MGKRKKRRPARQPPGKKRASAASDASEKRRQTGETPARQTDRRGAAIAYAVAALSGAMWILAAPRFDLWPLAWVAIAPLLWIVDRSPSPRRARRAAWVSGLVATAGGFSWIVELLTRHSNIPWPLALLALLLLGAYHGLVFWLFGLSVRRARDFSRQRLGAPLPMVLLAPLAMVAFETWLPMIFPFNLAVTQAWQTPVIQLAELTGPVGVTALLMIAGGAIYDVVTAASARRRVISAVAAVALIGGSLVFGLVRISQVEARRDSAPRLAVGLVQGNIPMDGPEVAQEGFPTRVLIELQRTSRELQERGAELIVWSESGFPYWMPRKPIPSLAEPVIRRDPLTLAGNPCLREQRDPEKMCWNAVKPVFSAPLVFGATTYREPLDPEDFPYNSAFLLEGDELVARFDKTRLVMFSEHFPLRDTFPSIAKIMPRGSGNFARGKEIVTFPLKVGDETYRLGPMICFEDTIASFGRELAALHPHLLVNLTNDTWFGTTSEPWQHLALSVFRAVEMRTDLVRAVNSGVSAVVDASGRVVAKTYAIDPAKQPMKMDSLLGNVALVEGGHTFYARFGGIFAYLCTAALLWLWLGWPLYVRRRERLRRP